jgi:hypothetical protein|tara:strand:+ start:1277 stop:1588 length:312 start_codon:yes stop_codon:yes gene_type:complete
MNTAVINLTDTMLKKSIIDANKSVCEFAKTFSFDYVEAEYGERKLLKASYPDGTPAKVTFYRAKTRGDKRISITKLKKYARAGDNVTLVNTDDNEGIKIIINV